MTYVKTHLPTLKTHVVNLKRDSKDLSRDLQRLEVRGKRGSKTLYCGHRDMQVCHSDVDTFLNLSDRTKTSDVKTTIVVDRSFPFRDQEVLSVHCAQSF